MLEAEVLEMTIFLFNCISISHSIQLLRILILLHLWHCLFMSSNNINWQSNTFFLTLLFPMYYFNPIKCSSQWYVPFLPVYIMKPPTDVTSLWSFMKYCFKPLDFHQSSPTQALIKAEQFTQVFSLHIGKAEGRHS